MPSPPPPPFISQSGRAGGEEKEICRNRLLCSAEMGVGMMG